MKLIKETDMLHSTFDDYGTNFAIKIVLKIFMNKKLYRYKYEMKFCYFFFKLVDWSNDYNFIIINVINYIYYI